MKNNRILIVFRYNSIHLRYPLPLLTWIPSKRKKKEEKTHQPVVVWFTLKKAFVKAGAWINLKAGRGPVVIFQD